MIKLLRYLKGNTRYAIFGALTKFFEALLELAFPLLMAKIIDDGIKQSNFLYIKQLSLIMLALAFAATIFTVLGQLAAAKAGHFLGMKLRNDLFSHILELNLDDKKNISNSELINNVNNDASLVEKGVALFIRLALRCFLICIGGIILALSLSPSLSLIIICLIPILGFIIYLFMKKSINLFKVTQAKLDDISKSTKEFTEGIRVIKSFNKETDEELSFINKNTTWEAYGIKTTKTASTITPIVTIIMHIAISLIIYIAYLIMKQNPSTSITTGILIAFISYINIIVNAIIQLANLATNFSKSIAAAKRINDTFELEPRMNYANKNRLDEKINKRILHIDNIKYSYYNNTALDISTSIEIFQGETLGVIGGTGSGKSTLSLLLKRLIDPKKGSIYFYENNLKDYTKEFLNNNISIVFQNDTLLNNTIRDNIKMNTNISDEEIINILKITCSYDFVKDFKNFLDHEITENAKNLSGGQRMRLCISRALANNPKMLILDDSFSALDYQTDYTLRQNLKKYYPNTLIVYISQRIATIKDCSKIIVLNHGFIAGIGSHNYLLENNAIYQEINNSQKKVN